MGSFFLSIGREREYNSTSLYIVVSSVIKEYTSLQRGDSDHLGKERGA